MAMAWPRVGDPPLSHRSEATSAIVTAPNDTACVIEGSNTTYQTSGVASSVSADVSSAIAPPNSRRTRR